MDLLQFRGGHRVGITGNVIIDKGKIINISDISSLNIRIAKQILGCSSDVLKEIINYEENTTYNTLIVSPPGVRKNNNSKRYNKAT
jgi:stage III sporulation protein AA